MKGFARCAKAFGLDPVGNREPGKVSKQGRGVFRREEALTATEPWPGVGGDRSHQETRGGWGSSFFLSLA